MGCCLSKKPSSIPLSSGGTSCDVNKSPDPVEPNVNKPVVEQPVKPEIELRENPAVEETKPAMLEKEVQEEEEEKDVLGRRRHERWKKKESEEAPSAAVAVRTSSCTKEEVDAILIQCGKLSRSNSPANTRRYSGSKRSFDLEEEEAAGRKTPQRNRVNGSPRERRRRTPSRERERERGGSRRVSRSPGKRSEAATNPNHPSGSLVNSSNVKFVTVPARDPSSKRVNNVKRSIGEACKRVNVQPPPPPPQPSLSRSSSRKAEQSPYRRTPLGEIDQNATKGDKKMIKREKEADKKKLTKPQGISRSRSLRKSRDFDLLQSSEQDKSSYTALLLKDIKDFHGKSNDDDDDDDDEDPFCRLPSCVTKACSIVEAVEDLNSNTSLSSDLNLFRFTSTVKKADLMEPSFEKYVTVRKRGCSLEEQESCGSNNIT